MKRFVRIPYSELSETALAAIVMEFVTRDGTDHSSVENRVKSVTRQLENGDVEVHFDHESESCQIVHVVD